MRVTRAVHFPLHPVSTISRPPTDTEFAVLSELEHHVRKCRSCDNFPNFTDSGLCGRGRYLLGAVSSYIYAGGNSHAYSTVFPTTRFIRVEVPSRFRITNKFFGLGYDYGKGRKSERS